METLMNVSEVVVDDFIEIPADKPELITVEPSREHIWVSGYWEREPGCWQWTPGRWEIPPHKQAHWVRGHWKWQDSMWHWHRGHWAVNHNHGYIVDEIIDIPEPLHETVPSCPSGQHCWVDGYWEWNGSWYWLPGRWSTKPHARAQWVPGQWEPFGTVSWRWIAGHWNLF